MSILGAQLDDLAVLADQLRQTAGDLATTRDSALTLSGQMVNTTRETAQNGLSTVEGQLTTMSASVTASVSQASAAQWTGANAERFREGAASFQANIEAGRTATTEAFSSFNTHIAALADALESYVQQFGTALAGAEESSHQMSAAVESQRANLDQVMNTGLAVG